MSQNPYDPSEPGADFDQDVKVDKPGIVGARWWHKTLRAEETNAPSRRNVLKGLLAAGGAMALMGYGVSKLMEEPKESTSLAKRSSLDMQKQYGWDFGARGKALVFDGTSQAPFVREALERLSAVMTPKIHTKFYVGTLVESLTAKPTAVLPDPVEGALPFTRLADVIVPMVTASMEKAYRAGEALARHCAGRQHLAVLADLPGPEAVAFAAGACGVFEPVLLFDNWPHPHGVVPSHLTLAALAYYQPRFSEQANARVYAEPIFVLDRSRLSSYSEQSDRFDNRYYARMPKLEALARAEIKGLFYVAPSVADLPEPDDLNGVLATGTTPPEVDVRALALTDFGNEADSSSSASLYYGGSEETDGSFWANYPIEPGFRPRSGQKIASSPTKDHRFAPRAAASPTPPSNLGTVAVIVTASGLLVAAALDRRGSMNRFSGGWSG